MKNLLFVSEGGFQRSPTFAVWFRMNRSQYKTKSVGTLPWARANLNNELVEWADIIFLMSVEEETHIKKYYPEYFYKCENMNIDNNFHTMEKKLPVLLEVVEDWVEMSGF